MGGGGVMASLSALISPARSSFMQQMIHFQYLSLDLPSGKGSLSLFGHLGVNKAALPVPSFFV